MCSTSRRRCRGSTPTITTRRRVHASSPIGRVPPGSRCSGGSEPGATGVTRAGIDPSPPFVHSGRPILGLKCACPRESRGEIVTPSWRGLRSLIGPVTPDLIWRAGIFVAALGVLIVITTRWTFWEGNAEWQSTDDAYLQADLTPIAAKVAGYVRTLPVQDFDRVHAGDVLAEIVDDDYRAAVAQLEASVASATAQIQALKAQRELQEANVQAARATIDATLANVGQNRRDVARQERLLKTGSSSTEAEEKLQTLRAQLAAQLAQNRAQATAAARQLAVLTAQQAQAEASMVAQTASLEIARINLGYTRILAPQDGVIGQRQIKPGQYVGIGGQITTLIPLPQ